MSPANESRPELTVVMPIRNEADQIGSVLDQLQAQSLPPERFEILVVDGMSEDGTREIVQAAMQRCPGIRFFDNPRGLSGVARNIGVQHATTPYVLFVDGHCRIESREMLATALAAFQRGERCLSRPQPLVGTGCRPFQTAVSLARGSLLGHYAGSKIYEAEDRHCNPLSAGCGYARDLYLELGGVDESFDAGEDLEFNLRVHQRGVMALHCHDLALAYLARPTWRDLFRQLYRYGHGRARMARKHPGSFSPLAAAVSLLSLWLAALPALGLVWRPAWVLWLGAAVPYALVVAATAAWLARGRGWRLWAATAACFPAIHFGAGVGYVSGLAGGPSWQHAPAPGAAACTAASPPRSP